MKIKKLTISGMAFLMSLFFSPNHQSLITNHCFASDWTEYQKYGHKGAKWDEYAKAGFSAFDSGNIGSAEMFFQRAIARGCSDGLIYAKIGLYYEAQKNYPKAIDYFRKAYKKLPGQYPGHELAKSIDETLGRVLFLAGRTGEAVPYLQRAASKNESFTALYFLGQISRAKRDYKSAVSFFERSLNAKHPEGLPPNINLLIMTEVAKGYYELKDYEASLLWWNRILVPDPGNQTAQSYKESIERQKYKEHERKVLEEIVQ